VEGEGVPFSWAELCHLGRVQVEEAHQNEYLTRTAEVGAATLHHSVHTVRSDLIRLPGELVPQGQGGHRRTAVGLYDTGASRSFLSARMAAALGARIRPTARPLRVSNGDGSFQVAAGEVELKLRIGPRFAQYFTFVVIDLAKYDYILGLPDILAYKLELQCAPVRVVAKVGGKAVELPLLFEEAAEPLSEAAGESATGWNMSLLTPTEFKQLAGSDPIFRVVPDGDGHILASLQSEDVETEDLEWSAMLHSLKADPDSDPAALDAAEAARKQAARIDEDQQRLRDRFPDTFADELPTRPSAVWPPGEEHARLRFKEGAEPRSVKQYRLPEGVRPALRKTIEEMLEHGLIEPHDGTGVNSPVLFAPKPGTTELRFCFDCRVLNKALADYHYPTPTTEELLDKVARLKQEARARGVEGPVWYSKADARHGFHQISVHPHDRKYLAFTVPVLDGSYRYTVMPMGLKSSSFEFQRRMDSIIAPFANRDTFTFVRSGTEQGSEQGGDFDVTKPAVAVGTCQIYCDDLLVVTVGSREEHEALLYATFQRFSDHKIVFKITKTALFKQEIDFLGHTLTQSGVKQQLGKVAAIANWPLPTSKDAVRSFLGLASYYRKFIHRFAAIAAPLSDLLRDGPFPQPVTAQAVEAFQRLKRAMCTAPVLAYYDSSRATELWTDASDYAIGGVLLQRDDKGAWRPVSYYSRRLIPSEVKYGVYHKELLAIRDCLLAFRYYLVGIPFVVKTDHHSIQWLLDQKELTGLQTRWLGVLQSFNITEIQYVPGERNVLADALSRNPDPDGESFEHLVPDAQLGIPVGPGSPPSSETPENGALHLLQTRAQRPADCLGRPGCVCDVCQYFYRAQSGQVVWDDAAASLGQWRGRPSKDLLQQQLDAATPTHLTSRLTDHPLQPRLQGSVDRPWTSPRTIDESLSDWLREGYNVSGRRPGPPSDWSAAYESCPDFMAPWAQRGDESAFQRTFPDFVADADNALYRQSPWGAEAAPDAEEDSHSGSYRLCVPTAKRREVLEEVHDSKTAGHMGSRRTLARLRSSGLHWPGMARDVEEFVATCEVCQRTKPAVAPQGIASPLEVPAGRWKVVSLDIVTGLPKSEGSDHDCVVTFTDRFSKQAYFCSAKFDGLTAEGVAELYIQHVYRVQGVPSIILSDRDSKFTSVFWERLFELLGTKLVYSAPYHHQSNGQVERLNQTLGNFLRAFLKGGAAWHKNLAVFEFAYNSAKHSATGVEPFRVVYGDVPPCPLATVNSGLVRSKAATDMADLLVNTRATVYEALEEAARSWRESNAAARVGHRFKAGDKVLLSTQHLRLQDREHRKTFPKFVGPFRVTRLGGHGNVELELDGRFRFIDRIVNVDRLRAYKTRWGTGADILAADPTTEALCQDPRGGTWWEVEDVVATRNGKTKNGRRQVQYLVRYKGFSEAYDEWKAEKDVSQALVQGYKALVKAAKAAGG
jgi:hypothetical protein